MAYPTIHDNEVDLLRKIAENTADGSGSVGGGAVSSVAGRTGAVTLTKTDVGLANVDNTSNATERAATATLANKTITAPVLSGTVTGTYTLGGTPTFPGSVVTTTGTQTLTNKTLTSPAVTTPTGIVKGDVGLGNVDNTSNATERAATATLTNKTISGASNTISAIAQASVTNLTTDLAAKQPLDSDLTSIAALTTTSYGRSLLTLANSAAGLTSLGAAQGVAPNFYSTGAIGLRDSFNPGANLALRYDSDNGVWTVLDSPAFRTALGVGTVGVTSNVVSLSSGTAFANYLATTVTQAAADLPFGLVAETILNGSATPTGGAHSVSILGWIKDGTSNRHPLYGIEGRVDGTGLSTAYIGVAADAGFQHATTFGGTLYGFTCSRLAVTTNGTTPLASGTVVGINIPAIVGGATKYSFVGRDALRVFSSNEAGSVSISHSGADGLVKNTTGALLLGATSSYVAIASGSLGFLPASSGMALGASVLPWAIEATTANFAGNVIMALAGSVTPATNGTMMIELTSNTSLTFKVKGSDGVVRSASVILV